MKNWGFDTKNIDKTVRPQDDFYQYANGGWLKAEKIPDDEASWGSFTILRVDTEKKLKKILDELLKKKSHKKGSPEQLVSDYFRAAFDIKRRNSLGITPLYPFIKKVEAISNTKELAQIIGYLHKHGVSGVWGSIVDQDSKNSEIYRFHLWQGGLGMPERDYYLLDKPEQKRIRDAYKVHIEKLLALAGFTKEECVEARDIVMKIETRLARASMNKEDARDPDKTYHKVAPSAFWREYLSLIGAPASVQHIIVGQPKFFKEVFVMFKNIPLNEWKTYLTWHLINDFAGALSEPFIEENFDFYNRTMYGMQKMRPLWRRALSSTNAAIAEPFGKLYVAKYFPESSKKKMDALVDDLFEVFEERMQNLDWMSPATKKKAIAKLHAMGRKIGYPKKWDLYKGVVIKADDYFGNMMRVHAHAHKKEMRKLGSTVDRDEWFMSPQMVNAYNHFNLNEIVFPAAILQFPFFDPSADDAVNYGSIGAVIGHEMTHGFDDKGAKFDAKGNLKDWWTSADKKKFEERGKIIEKQADAYEVAPGVRMSGKLTLGENISDYAGLVLGFYAYQKHLAKTGRKDIHGLSPEVRFFLSFAQQERTLRRPELAKMAALTDPHADAPFRVNGPVSHFDPFYETFGVKKGDKLYREPSKRARIW